MSEKYKKKNLPSTNTSVGNTHDEGNGAKGTKKDNNSVVNTGAVKGGADGTINDIPETEVDMLDLVGVKDSDVHKKDIQKVIDVTTALIQKNYKNEQVRKMYICYQTCGKHLLQNTT